MAPKSVGIMDLYGTSAARAAARIDSKTIERRAAHRFPLDVMVEFEQGHNPKQPGLGKLINISSRGLLMDAGRWIGTGVRISLKVPWPARLNGVVSLTLNIEGQTVRTDHNLVAIRISRAEFRTRTSVPAHGSGDGL
jgi:hypothetical protein